MLYTKLTKQAMIIAYTAHHGQVDKTGLPYIFHPLHLAEQCEDEKTTIVALLHDVVEDCEEYTFDKLETYGFDAEVISALKLLTHEKGVPYEEYVKKIKSNPLATKVKLLDLSHNLNETRFDENERDEKLNRMAKKREKYIKAKEYLENDSVTSS